MGIYRHSRTFWRPVCPFSFSLMLSWSNRDEDFVVVLQVAAILMKSHIRKTLPLKLCRPYLAPRIWVSGRWVPVGAHACRVTHLPLVESRIKCRHGLSIVGNANPPPHTSCRPPSHRRLLPSSTPLVAVCLLPFK